MGTNYRIDKNGNRLDEQGRITNPGKFEGEPSWVPEYWDDCMQSAEDEIRIIGDTEYSIFELDHDQRERLGVHTFDPVVTHLALWETDRGFVHHLFYTAAAYKTMFEDYEPDPEKCECDNTHKQNDTVCRWCWARGRRHWNNPDIKPDSLRDPQPDTNGPFHTVKVDEPGRGSGTYPYGIEIWYKGSLLEKFWYNSSFERNSKSREIEHMLGDEIQALLRKIESDRPAKQTLAEKLIEALFTEHLRTYFVGCYTEDEQKKFRREMTQTVLKQL